MKKTLLVYLLFAFIVYLSSCAFYGSAEDVGTERVSATCKETGDGKIAFDKNEESAGFEEPATNENSPSIYDNAKLTDMLKNAVVVNTTGSSEREISTLYQLTGTGICEQYGDFTYKTECSVLKITPKDYEFYITVNHLDDDSYFFDGYTMLKAKVTDVIENFNGGSIEAGDIITVRQDLYITPSDEYMNFLADICDVENKDLIPDGDYKIDTDKLSETGIKRIVTYDTPLLEYEASYYVFTTAKTAQGYTWCLAYCDTDLDPVKIGSNGEENASYFGDYENFAHDLAQIVKEYEK